MKPYFLLAIILTGCGFHLRGTLPEETHLPKTVQLSFSQPSDLATNLSKTLQEAFFKQGLRINKNSPYRIVIHTIFNRKIPISLSTQQHGNSKEVTLIDGFTVQLFYNQKPLFIRDINSQSVIQYRSSAYLGSSREEDNAHHQLAYENAEKLIHFLNSSINTIYPKKK